MHKSILHFKSFVVNYYCLRMTYVSCGCDISFSKRKQRPIKIKHDVMKDGPSAKQTITRMTNAILITLGGVGRGVSKE